MILEEELKLGQAVVISQELTKVGLMSDGEGIVVSERLENRDGW